MKTTGGSYHLQRRKNSSGRVIPVWYVYLRPKGGGKASLVASGFEMCAGCVAAVVVPAVCRCRTKPAAAAERKLAEWNEIRWHGAGSAADFALPRSRANAADAATVGDLHKCVSENWSRVFKKWDTARQNLNSMRRYLAIALDLWVKVERRTSAHKVGELAPDVARIDKVRLRAALSVETARAYFAKLVPDGAEAQERLEHVTINRRFSQMRDLFSRKMRERIFHGRLTLPEKELEGLDKFPLVSVPPSEPAPITGEAFTRLVEAGEALRESDPDLWLLARVARQTGLRCGSLMDLSDDWVEPFHGGWRLVARVRKRGTAVFAVPITAELAALIKARPGFTFGESRPQRWKLVNRRHNEFMLQVAGNPPRGKQKAHRLRDTLAGGLWALLGLEGAKMALGHENVATTLKHYARLPFEVTPVMRAEYAAFL